MNFHHKRPTETHFQGATWRQCQTHFIRNILDAWPKSLQGELHRWLRLIFDAPNIETVRRLKRNNRALWRPGAKGSGAA
nr:transposase [Desulfofundulus thermobenzoicus]